MSNYPDKFGGDFSSLWKLDVMPPIHRLSWWWYWVIIFIPDPDNPKRSRQLMTLWSTKETEAIRVSGYWWKPGSRMYKDEHEGFVIPGMVCAWWYDGENMFEPMTMKECRMGVFPDTHPLYPGEGFGDGAGAIVPLNREDMSFGMRPGNSSFWLRVSSDQESRSKGAPSIFEAELTPWWGPPSSLTYKNNILLANGMGYDILRLQGTLCKLKVDDEEFHGFISNLRVGNGTAVYTSDFTPPTSELTLIPNTVLLCCQDTDNPLREATGKTITGFGSLQESNDIELVTNSGFAVDISGWTASGVQWSHSSGALMHFDSSQQAFKLKKCKTKQPRDAQII